MISPPRTQAEARAYRYRQWAGRTKDVAYQEGRCAYQIMGVWRPVGQCSRLLLPGHGPGLLYCRQHARIIARREMTT